jgi:hypothetical protein
MLAALVVCALPPAADAATRFVTHTGSDTANCGLDLATACRSISKAIQLANVGDTISVGPGRYGDLNRNGVLGDFPGEESGSPGCSCVVSMNKAVIILSTSGAAQTIIDGRTVNVVQTVVVLSNGGEFGRPGKGFTVTETGRRNANGQPDGHGIGIDAANVRVRGNQVVFSRQVVAPNDSRGTGIFTVNSAAVRIEGNLVANWNVGIHVLVASAATINKNQITANIVGIVARGGKLTGNVISRNASSGIVASENTTISGNAALQNGVAFTVQPPETTWPATTSAACTTRALSGSTPPITSGVPRPALAIYRRTGRATAAVERQRLRLSPLRRLSSPS